MDKLINELSDKITQSLPLKTNETEQIVRQIVQTTLKNFNIMPQVDFERHKTQLAELIKKLTALEAKSEWV